MGIKDVLILIKDLLTGKYTFANKQTIISRNNICNDCPVQSDHKTCTACGCWLPLKTRLKESECPLDEWVD